ncbi:MAG: glycosyltransferase family 9 protein [Candidatus Omnitrophica bacterium]|nr:glycosyltransferase family 9 protein [Candidatus Omnitrophota bacterium]
MKKALIINPFGIGDVLFTTPLARALKENFGGISIGYWCNQRVAPILEDNPHIDQLFRLSRGDLKKISRASFWRGLKELLKLINSVRREHFDACFDFSLDHRYGLAAKIAGIRKRIGLNYKNRGRFLTDKIDISGYKGRHVVEFYLDLLKPLGITVRTRNPELFVSAPEKNKALEILKKNDITAADLVIGIAPGAGASWGRDSGRKQWRPDKFALLIDKLSQALNSKIILLGDITERPIAEKIISLVKTRPLDLVGRTTLKEFIAFLDVIDILVANDGGPLHMASALGKKTVSFFGPVDPEVYGPYPPDKQRHLVLDKYLECSPCYNDFRLMECRNHRDCLNLISVEEAFGAVEKLLPGEKR